MTFIQDIIHRPIMLFSICVRKVPFPNGLGKKNHLVHLVIANALKPTHTLTILEPISDFDVPEK